MKNHFPPQKNFFVVIYTGVLNTDVADSFTVGFVVKFIGGDHKVFMQ